MIYKFHWCFTAELALVEHTAITYARYLFYFVYIKTLLKGQKAHLHSSSSIS